MAKWARTTTNACFWCSNPTEVTPCVARVTPEFGGTVHRAAHGGRQGAKARFRGVEHVEHGQATTFFVIDA